MKRFSQMIGEEITGLIPMMDPKIFKVLRLHAVDAGGLWVESEEFTQVMLSQLKITASPNTPLIYLPFHEIKFLIQGTKKLSLSDKAFGA